MKYKKCSTWFPGKIHSHWTQCRQQLSYSQNVTGKTNQLCITVISRGQVVRTVMQTLYRLSPVLTPNWSPPSNFSIMYHVLTLQKGWLKHAVWDNTTYKLIKTYSIFFLFNGNSGSFISAPCTIKQCDSLHVGAVLDVTRSYLWTFTLLSTVDIWKECKIVIVSYERQDFSFSSRG